MTRRMLVATWIVALAASPCAADVAVRGRLLLPGTEAGASDASALARGRPMDAVVYLEEVPKKLEKKLAKKARKTRHAIVQEDMQFRPRVTVLTVGDTLRIQNLDNVYHSAFSVSSARRFDLGKYPPGEVHALVFDTTGVVNLHCDIHPRMLGFVVVLANHAYVQPDSEGRFQLPKLPKGHYVLSLWHPRLGTRQCTVEVPKKGHLDLEWRL